MADPTPSKQPWGLHLRAATTGLRLKLAGGAGKTQPRGGSAGRAQPATPRVTAAPATEQRVTASKAEAAGGSEGGASSSGEAAVDWQPTRSGGSSSGSRASAGSHSDAGEAAGNGSFSVPPLAPGTPLAGGSHHTGSEFGIMADGGSGTAKAGDTPGRAGLLSIHGGARARIARQRLPAEVEWLAEQAAFRAHMYERC